MKDSYSLRDYILVMLEQGRFIVMMSLLLSFAGLLFLLLWPRQYRAESLIILTQQNYSLRFDERFETIESSLNRDVILSIYNALPPLAMSDALLSELLVQLDPPLPEAEHNLKGLRDRLQASLQNNSSTLILSALSPDPAEAQRIVNQWAQYFVPVANSLYAEGQAELERLQGELASARQLRDDAERRMIDFRADDKRVFLNSELNAMRSSYDIYRLHEQEVQQLRLDLASFAVQLADQAAEVSATLEDELTLLRLQMAVHGFADATAPVVQIESGAEGPVSERPRSAIRSALDDLQRSLDTRLESLALVLAELERDSTLISNEIDLLNFDFERVQEELNVARQTFNTLRVKVEESQITVNLADDRIRLASLAALPNEPDGPSRAFLGLIIAGVALALSLSVAFFRAYWRESANSQI